MQKLQVHRLSLQRQRGNRKVINPFTSKVGRLENSDSIYRQCKHAEQFVSPLAFINSSAHFLHFLL